MFASRWLAAVFVFVELASAACGAGDGFSVVSRSGSVTTAAPGAFYSSAVAVERDPPYRAIVLRDRVLAPDGWTVAAPLGLPFSPTGREEIRLVALAIPRAAAAGTYRMFYILTDNADPSVEYGRLELTIVVTTMTKLEVEPDGATERVVAGNPITARWRIANRGNSAATYDLRARSSLDFTTHATPSVLTLAGGQTGVVSVEAATPKELRREQGHSLVLEIKSRGPSAEMQSVAAMTTVQPRFTLAEPDARDIDVTVTTETVARRTGGRSEFGAQVELAGGGSLNGDLNQRLDFLLRPSASGKSAGYLGRDQYSIGYRSKHLDLLLGDQLFTLSPLTQRWLTGRGAEIEYRQAGRLGGMYFATTPWAFRDSEQAGFYVQSQVAQGLSLRGNLLLQQQPARLAEDLRSVIPSLQVQLQPTRNVSLELEGALSENDDETRGDAYRARLRGRCAEGVYYDIERVRASPRYFGYYRDLELTSANVTWQLNRDWQAHVGIQAVDTNLNRDPLGSSARSFRSDRVGLDRRLAPKLTLSLEGEAVDTVDHLFGGEPSLSENTGALAATWTAERLFLRAEVQAGRARVGSFLPAARSVERYSLIAVARPRQAQTLSLMVETGDARYAVKPRRETSVTAASEWNFLGGFRLRAAGSVNRSEGASAQTERSVEMAAGYDFRSGSTIDLRVREAVYSDHRRDESVLLSYAVHLRAASFRKKVYGSLEGSIEAVVGAVAQPLANAILHLDRLQAATDATGHFVFPILKPGRYTLTVDAVSLGAGFVLEDQRPMVIEIAPKTRSRLRLTAVQAARVEGKVEVYADVFKSRIDTALSEGEMKASHGLGDVAIELRREGMASHRTLTDENGRFAFYKLPPGDWKVVIDQQATPASHRLEQGEFLVHLGPGELGQVEARILPVRRKMQMLDQRALGVTSIER